MRSRKTPSITLVIPLLPGTCRELFDTICHKYPDRIPPALTDPRIPFADRLFAFEALLLQLSGDPDIREIIARKFCQCKTGGPLFGNPALPQDDLFARLDEGSAVILRTLCDRNHATLGDLSALSGLTHADVLERLRRVIIPGSMKIWGRPIVVFRESALDLSTGEPVTFSWWLNAEVLYGENAAEVMETDDRIIITLGRAGRDLPGRMRAIASCTHGVLEIVLDKREMAEDKK
ncbi:MAG: hypothetical protein LUQ31_03080 [Methanoregula sp.]|nr:hypothetical protein [Methanoregula sp.]